MLFLESEFPPTLTQKYGWLPRYHLHVFKSSASWCTLCEKMKTFHYIEVEKTPSLNTDFLVRSGKESVANLEICTSNYCKQSYSQCVCRLLFSYLVSYFLVWSISYLVSYFLVWSMKKIIYTWNKFANFETLTEVKVRVGKITLERDWLFRSLVARCVNIKFKQ
jgi:hypothetical protein